MNSVMTQHSFLLLYGGGRPVGTSEAYARYQPEGLIIHSRHTRLETGPIIQVATSSMEVMNEKE